MQEFETSDRLARELESLGYSVTRNIGKAGLVGTLRNGEGPVLLPFVRYVVRGTIHLDWLREIHGGTATTDLETLG